MLLYALPTNNNSLGLFYERHEKNLNFLTNSDPFLELYLELYYLNCP